MDRSIRLISQHRSIDRQFDILLSVVAVPSCPVADERAKLNVVVLRWCACLCCRLRQSPYSKYMCRATHACHGHCTCVLSFLPAVPVSRDFSSVVFCDRLIEWQCGAASSTRARAHGYLQDLRRFSWTGRRAGVAAHTSGMANWQWHACM